MLDQRYSIYLHYWYKSTKSDAKGALEGLAGVARRALQQVQALLLQETPLQDTGTRSRFWRAMVLNSCATTIQKAARGHLARRALAQGSLPPPTPYTRTHAHTLTRIHAYTPRTHSAQALRGGGDVPHVPDDESATHVPHAPDDESATHMPHVSARLPRPGVFVLRVGVGGGADSDESGGRGSESEDSDSPGCLGRGNSAGEALQRGDSRHGLAGVLKKLQITLTTTLARWQGLVQTLTPEERAFVVCWPMLTYADVC